MTDPIPATGQYYDTVQGQTIRFDEQYEDLNVAVISGDDGEGRWREEMALDEFCGQVALGYLVPVDEPTVL